MAVGGGAAAADGRAPAQMDVPFSSAIPVAFPKIVPLAVDAAHWRAVIRLLALSVPQPFLVSDRRERFRCSRTKAGQAKAAAIAAAGSVLGRHSERGSEFRSVCTLFSYPVSSWPSLFPPTTTYGTSILQHPSKLLNVPFEPKRAPLTSHSLSPFLTISLSPYLPICLSPCCMLLCAEHKTSHCALPYPACLPSFCCFALRVPPCPSPQLASSDSRSVPGSSNRMHQCCFPSPRPCPPCLGSLAGG